MTKSEIRDKQICPLSIIFEAANSSKNFENCWAEQFSKTLISIRFNLLQFCPSVAGVVSVVLFLPAFNVLRGYFYVSFNLTGILQ